MEWIYWIKETAVSERTQRKLYNQPRTKNCAKLDWLNILFCLYELYRAFHKRHVWVWLSVGLVVLYTIKPTTLLTLICSRPPPLFLDGTGGPPCRWLGGIYRPPATRLLGIEGTENKNIKYVNISFLEKVKKKANETWFFGRRSCH